MNSPTGYESEFGELIMELKTNSGANVELQTPVTEWVRMTDDPFNDDGLVICDAGDRFMLVRMHPLLGPVKIVDSGSEIRARANYDRDAVIDDLTERFGDVLDGDDITSLFDTYEDIVTYLVEGDLTDCGYETTFVEGFVYISGMDTDALADEVATAIDDWEYDLAPALATHMESWWTPTDEELSDLAATHDFSATIELLG